MKTLEVERAQADLNAAIATAQTEQLLLTRAGKPAALVIGVENWDEEDWGYATDPQFWAMIEESRKQPTMTSDELQEYLRKHDEQVAGN